MRGFNISAVHVAFLFSLIFHVVILSMSIDVDIPEAAPVEVFKIRYLPAVAEKKEVPVKEQVVTKKQKPVEKIAMPIPEIPVEKPKEIPEEAVTEIPEVAEKIPVEIPEEIPVEMPKKIVTEIPEEITTEIPEHTEKQAAKEDVYELPDEVAEEPAEEPAVAVAAHAKTIPAMPKIKEISPEIDLLWIAEELRKRIEAIKRYPRMARRMGIEGTVVMIIEFDKMGKLIDIYIKSSAGHRILDRDALSLVERVSPLRHGTGRNIVVELPITYDLIER